MFPDPLSLPDSALSDIDLKQHQDLFIIVPIGIFTSTPEGRLCGVNPALIKLLGYDSAQALTTSKINTAIQLYADPKDRKEVQQLLEMHGQVTNYKRGNSHGIPHFGRC